MQKIILMLLVLLSTLYSRDVVDEKGSCKINWTLGSISCEGESAEGQNRFAAKLSAKIIAQRNLLEVVKGVHIDSVTTIEDGMLGSDIITSRVSGMIRGTQVLSNIFNDEYRYSVATVKLQMGKDLLSALLSDPNQLSWNEKVQKVWNSFDILTTANASSYVSSDKKTLLKVLEDLRMLGDTQSAGYVSEVLEGLDSNVYSGILIDVSGIENFQKAMIVKLVDENGKEVYPGNYVSKKTLLKKNTTVGYMYGFDDARNSKRVFSTPIELKASSVYKKRYSNIVLTQEQLNELNSLDKSVLSDAKVILVLGE